MLKLVGKKIGMTHLFGEDGSIVPLTAILIWDNCVISKTEVNKSGSASLLIGFKKVKKTKKISKPLLGFFNKNSTSAFETIVESKIENQTFPLNVGSGVDIEKLLERVKKLNVRSITAGKGFAGVMKRWNFRGLEASHGVSVSHRSHGSTGQRQDPGKTFPGKKMAGHMGVKLRKTKNLEIVSFDSKNSLVFLKGCIPGRSGSEVVLEV